MGNDNSGETRERERAEAAEEGRKRTLTEKQALQEKCKKLENERNIQILREDEKKKIDMQNRFKEEEERKRINIEKQNAQNENTNKTVS